ncbi:MAG TPA: ATP-binding protein [Gemmataceae bacterium]|jgi:PAS domain S-box-containing protein
MPDPLPASDRFRLMADAAPVLIWVSGPDKGRTWVNKPWLDFTGRLLDRELGAGWADNVHPDDRPRVLETYATHFDARTPFTMEYRLRRHDGVYRWVMDNGVPLTDAAGAFAGYVGSAVDITEHRSAEDRLRDADRRKDEFLAMLAHELRNPLAPLRNALQLLRLPDFGGQPLEHVRGVMERQVEHLVRMVDDLVDVARLLQDQIGLRPAVIDVRAAVRRAVETAQPVIDARGHRLALDLPADPVPVRGDLVRLAQALSNLLANAAKFTARAGLIRVAVAETDGSAVVRVRDTGAGIPPELLPHVFDLFVQADRSAARTQGGLGVGLTLVKRLIEMHGGTIEAHSAGPGKGSEFVVRLPLAADAVRDGGSEVSPHSPLPALQSLRVLVVDDNVDAAESLAVLLRAAGHDARTAHSGPEAVAAAAVRPTAVVLDIGLPGMDGYAVARELRRRPETAGAKLIALTGYGQDADRDKAREAGFDHHLTKPVEFDELQRLLVG